MITWFVQTYPSTDSRHNGSPPPANQDDLQGHQRRRHAIGTPYEGTIATLEEKLDLQEYSPAQVQRMVQEKTMLEEGAWTVNPRYGLRWTVLLKAGETKELVSRYELLVDR